MTRTQERSARIGAPARTVAGVVACSAAVQTGVLVVAGLVITHPPGGWWDPGERGVVAWLAAHRSPALTTASAWLSTLAFTPAIVAVTAVAAAVVLILRQWRGAALLAGAVALQATVFVTAAHLVDRSRPEVLRLDGALPTSSFPSGHVGAATALYGGLGLLALRAAGGRAVAGRGVRGGLDRAVAGGRLTAVPGHAPPHRRGGGCGVNGAAALWVVSRALSAGERRSAVPDAPGHRSAPPADDRAGGPVALVYNPVGVDDALLDQLAAAVTAHGHLPPRLLPGSARQYKETRRAARGSLAGRGHRGRPATDRRAPPTGRHNPAGCVPCGNPTAIPEIELPVTRPRHTHRPYR
ncbi:hypothetical protein GCM10020229_62290 [Kitasatospora albolonga]|uniref:hypothetical protein n=1 Tax=Kitasatospora albolonga TaxID=68173 RepID=UPI0031E53D33